jgi:general secretion pathway protein I
LSQSTALKGVCGFTLIEALVALSIVAVVLAPIGALIASSTRGGHSIEAHLTRLETARSVMTALPSRNQLAPGATSGQIARHLWRIDVLPLAAQGLGSHGHGQWVPQAVVVTVKAPSGASLEINTIRLQRRNIQ